MAIIKLELSIKELCMSDLKDIPKQVYQGYDTDRFVDGMRDAKLGKPHKSQCESYDAGYSAQYTLEQVRGGK